MNITNITVTKTAEEKTDGVIITETIDFVLAGRSIALFRRP